MVCGSEKMMKTGRACLSLALLSAVPCPLLGSPSNGFCQQWGDWATVATVPDPYNTYSNPSHFSLVLNIHYRVFLSTPGLVLFL